MLQGSSRPQVSATRVQLGNFTGSTEYTSGVVVWPARRLVAVHIEERTPKARDENVASVRRWNLAQRERLGRPLIHDRRSRSGQSTHPPARAR